MLTFKNSKKLVSVFVKKIEFRFFLVFVNILFLIFSCNSIESESRIIELNGEWEFTEDFSFDKDPQVIIWKKIQFPEELDSLPMMKNYNGRIAVRRKLPIELNDAIKNKKPLTLDMGGQVSDVVTVFINNQQISNIGTENPYQTGLFRHPIIDISKLVPDIDNVLLITFYSQGTFPIGAYGQKVLLGESNKIYANYYKSEIILFSFLIIYLAVGFYHLLLSVKRTKELYNLYFGIFAILFACLGFFYSASRDLIFEKELLLRMKIHHCILFNIPTFFIFFMSQFFYSKHSRFGIISAIVFLVMTIIDVLGSYPIMQKVLLAWYLYILVVAVYLVVYIIRESLKKNKDAYYLLSGVIILMLGVVNDILWDQGMINTVKVSSYTFLIFVLGIAGTLANRFVRIHNQVEELNQSLELKVEERTLELQETLQKVNDLKTIQDGDYFLTSLLLVPLGGNYTNSDSVHIEYLVSQKKKFQFKNWNSEIGGDLIVVHSITLRNKPFTVFLNGDAMGKSIQGAGGALVLGTVFKAVITRTRDTEAGRNNTPERWLKECFLELQNIFVSFEGSMLISAVIGLVDDSSGLLYYINSEHPNPVLYRDGVAEFLENDSSPIRKIGTEGIESHLVIKTFPLRSGDVVLFGSDGRDDLYLGIDSDGQRVINDDENKFLKSVESGEGNLIKIKEELLKTGELIDDLSLIRIYFHSPKQIQYLVSTQSFDTLKKKYFAGEKEEALSEMDKIALESWDDIQFIREYAIFCLKLKFNQKSAELCERYTELDPADTEFLYLTSYAQKKAGQLEKAADYGERCRLREPSMIKNLNNLADIYRLKENFQRSKQFVNEVLSREPDNSQALGLLSKLVM